MVNTQRDYGKHFGALMMAVFGVIAFYRWHQTQLIFFLLLVLRDFVAAYFFLKRNLSKEKSQLSVSILAYASAALPLFYFSATHENKELLLTSDLLVILGFFLVSLATIELGSSIGISPANRGLVQTGIYRYLKHPMYVGYILAEIGMVLLNVTNLWIFVLSVSLYFFRSRFENKVLGTRIGKHTAFKRKT